LLNDQGCKSRILDRDSSGRDAEWFNAVDDAHDLVLYQADHDGSPWTHLCLRGADRILLLADASQAASVTGSAIDAV
jgi:NTE family protein